MQYDDPYYEEAEADWYDDDFTSRPKEEPDCGGCNDSGWIKPRGYRRVLARVLPLCVVWWQWNGLIGRWYNLAGYWPCDGCNPCWIDTWWLPTQMRRLRWWWWRHRWGRQAGSYYGDEPPF